MSIFKIIDASGFSCGGGSGQWLPGEWREVDGPLVSCRNGLHLCRTPNLVLWLAEDCVVWRAECDGEIIDDGDKIVARRARVVERIGTSTQAVLWHIACWCARYTPLGDGRTVWDLLRDDRLKHAVDTAEKRAEGGATEEELRAAWKDARDCVDGINPLYAKSAALAAAISTVPSGDLAWDARRVSLWASVAASGAGPINIDDARRAQGEALLEMLRKEG